MAGVAFIQNELGNRLQALLRGLLFEVRFEVITQVLNDGILDNNERVAKAIRSVGKKLVNSDYLNE